MTLPDHSKDDPFDNPFHFFHLLRYHTNFLKGFLLRLLKVFQVDAGPHAVILEKSLAFALNNKDVTYCVE